MKASRRPPADDIAAAVAMGGMRKPAAAIRIDDHIRAGKRLEHRLGSEEDNLYRLYRQP
jgi:hypothetical protein